MINEFYSYESVKKIIIIAIFFTFLGAIDYYFSISVFPITEGWWETYAWFIKNGLKPYIDFSLKFPPLYVYYNVFLINIFDVNYLNLRISAIFLHSLQILIVFFWLRRFVTFAPAVGGAFFAAALVMSNPVYLTKDYHTMVMLFVSIILLVNQVAIEKIERNSLGGFLFILISGLLCGVLLTIKQNVGVFFSLSVFFMWILFVFNTGVTYKKLFLILFGFLLFLSIPALVLTSLIGPQWISVYLDNDSKGNVLTILFRFILDKNSLLIELIALFYIFSIYLVITVPFLKNKALFIQQGLLRSQYHKISLLVFLLIFFLKYPSISVISFALAWPFIRLLLLKQATGKIDFNYFLIAIPLMGLAYSGTLSAGFNSVTLEALVALAIAELIYQLKLVLKIKEFFIYILILLGLIIVFAPKFLGYGYDWWGYRVSLLIEAGANKLTFPELAGISSDAQTAKIFNLVNDIKLEANVADRIFAYPSIPIFYQLLNKKPYHFPVLWFDVASTNDGSKTAQSLEEAPPKYIFWLKPPQRVYSGHFMLRKKDPAMLAVDDWIEKNIRNGKYQVVQSIPTYSKGQEYRTYIESKATVNIKNSINQIIAMQKQCYELKGCSVGNLTHIIDSDFGSLDVIFSNHYYFEYFISNAKFIVDSDDFIFYILKLNNN